MTDQRPIAVIALGLLALGGTAVAQQSDKGGEAANPASAYCVERGGSLEIETDSDGGKHGVCVLGDQRCDEWALYRGECRYRGEIDDPFAFCAMTGDSDVTALSQSGEGVPTVLQPILLRQGVISDAMPPSVQQATLWRCMDGFVWACAVGANLPCLQKADVSETPSESLVTFCRCDPEAESIPAYVTGRATVYAWGCDGGVPSIREQVRRPDARGYLAEFWHRVEAATARPRPGLPEGPT